WSNIKGGWTGEGNINANPLFADSMTGDYHLTSGSPCIDAGIALFVWHGDTLFNIPGDKIVGPNPDIGAFEFDLVPISNQRNNQVKTSFLLHQNYPNPFNSTTQIRYSLVRSDYIKVTVYDAQGKVIAKLVNEIQAAGEYNIAWNSTDARENPISSGIYFIELRSKFVQQVRKMLLIR
ncbi:MAG: T9SS type A sorting domain-containing protein, partial [Calditrichota bacterium]